MNQKGEKKFFFYIESIFIYSLYRNDYETLFEKTKRNVTFQAKTRVHKPFYWENTGIYREVYRVSPGCTRKFPGIWLSLLWIHWEIPGSAGELTEKARDLPGYRDELPGISPVNDQ